MIPTAHLDLIPATPALLRAELAGPEARAVALGVKVPPSWPPEFMDAPTLTYTLDRLEDGPGQAGWWSHYIVVRADLQLAGVAGYKGPPKEGMVEVGYSLLAEAQRRGIATEATGALIDRAFAHAEVDYVQAETLPTLTPSIRVLEKLGFVLLGKGSEHGVIRYRLDRPPPARPRP